MASNREKLKEMMATSRNIAEESTRTTVIDDLVEEYDRVETAKEAGLLPEAPQEKPAKKRAPGRPRKFSKDEDTVVLGIRVKKEEALFLEEYGGKFGGKTGYVTHLIRQEMDRVYQLKVLD